MRMCVTCVCAYSCQLPFSLSQILGTPFAPTTRLGVFPSRKRAPRRLLLLGERHGSGKSLKESRALGFIKYCVPIGFDEAPRQRKKIPNAATKWWHALQIRLFLFAYVTDTALTRVWAFGARLGPADQTTPLQELTDTLPFLR